MMFHYPYWGTPYYNRYSRYGYSYSNYSNPTPNYPHPVSEKSIKTNNNSSFHSQKNSIPKEEIHTPKKEERTLKEDDDKPLFQIFGLDIYFDDILLVCLIFFLYQEGVTDQGLFIALVLLLLS